MEILILAVIGAAGAGAVLAPVLLADRSPGTDAARPSDRLADDAEIDGEVARYRAALRSGTLCKRCLRANPEESRYCADCGRRLDGRPVTA